MAGLWNELGQVKPIFLEPKDKKDFSEAIDGFYKKIREPDCQAAIFLAVCRGKAAEGLDFTDANGRAVIVTVNDGSKYQLIIFYCRSN
eukprot:m.155056 g.155056  ORF g.155056 m.155056 type:complete len:88 (+) comp38653_c0_seq1:1595-1858(+)